MKRALIVTTCVGLLLTGVARADLEEGTYAPDFEAGDWFNLEGEPFYGEPVSMSELRGMVVVLYFWVTWHRGGEYFMPLINLIENNRSAGLGRRDGVFLIGVTESDRSRVEDMVEEHRLFFPIAMECDAKEDYDISSFPRAVIIDPSGKIAYSGSSGQEFVNKLREVIADTPPTRTHPREVVDANRYLDRARESIREGDYKAAFHAARNAYQRALTGDDLKTRCQDMLDLIESLGRNRLAEGMRLVDEKKYEEGVTVLRDVMRLFRGLATGKTAKKRLRALEDRYPDVQRVLESLKRDAEARGLLVSVEEDLMTRKFGRAYETLERIISDYSQTPIVPDARTILQRMEKNQTIMGYVIDHKAASDCNNWLGQARGFIRIGKLNKAKELLRKVINTYAETRYAEEAYEILAELD